MSAIPYSVLDLVPVAEGSVPAESFRRSRDLARRADELMFNGPIVDHQARLRSFEIAAELMQSL